jgi:GDSL-like Lipase/Acylhydrolase family
MLKEKAGIKSGARVYFEIALNALFLVGALFTAELYLRATVFDPTKRYILLPGWEIIRQVSHNGTPGIDRDSHIFINRLGIRGDLPSAQSFPRILALGSSTTMDVALNDSDSWAGQLQTTLRARWPTAWIGNGGRAGATVHHCIAALKEMLNRWPTYDDVIVTLGTSDMLYDLRIHFDQRTDPQSAWTEDQVFMFVPSDVWYERLAMFQLIKPIFDRWLTGGSGRPGNLGSELERYKSRRQRVQAEDWITEPPDLTAKLSRFRSLVIELLAVADAHRTRLILVTSPSPWKTSMTDAEMAKLFAGGLAPPDDWEGNARVKWYAVKPMMKALDLYNDVIRSICVERALTCVDLDRELGRSSDYFYDDFHFSRIGATRVAEILSRRLMRSR